MYSISMSYKIVNVKQFFHKKIFHIWIDLREKIYNFFNFSAQIRIFFKNQKKKTILVKPDNPDRGPIRTVT